MKSTRFPARASLLSWKTATQEHWATGSPQLQPFRVFCRLPWSSSNPSALNQHEIPHALEPTRTSEGAGGRDSGQYGGNLHSAICPTHSRRDRVTENPLVESALSILRHRMRRHGRG